MAMYRNPALEGADEGGSLSSIIQLLLSNQLTGPFKGQALADVRRDSARPTTTPGPLPKGGGHRARGGVGLGSGAMKPQTFSRNPHQEEKDFATQLRRKAAEARALADVESDSVNRQLSEKMRLVQQLLGGNKRYMTTEHRTSQTPVNQMGFMEPMNLTETTQRDYTPEIQQQLMQLLFR